MHIYLIRKLPEKYRRNHLLWLLLGMETEVCGEMYML